MTDLERVDIANMIGLVIVQLRLRSATYDQAVEQLGYVQFRLDHPNWHKDTPLNADEGKGYYQREAAHD